MWEWVIVDVRAGERAVVSFGHRRQVEVLTFASTCDVPALPASKPTRGSGSGYNYAAQRPIPVPTHGHLYLCFCLLATSKCKEANESERRHGTDLKDG